MSEFLRALQLHFFQYGMSQSCISDLGSQIIKGSNIITDFLRDVDTVRYFEEHGISPIKFEQYFKGRSQLGALVEVCVKFTKRLLFGAIKTNVVSVRDFEFIIEQTIHLINRRPIAFKESLRDSMDADIVEPITPENLIHGFDLVSVNIIPDLQPNPDSEDDADYHNSAVKSIKDNDYKLRKIRSNLITLYHEEFLSNLMYQAIDSKSRYRIVKHKTIKEGDVVIVKELFTKSQNYPMAVIKEVHVNINNEVTHATLRKGRTGELIKRHVTNLIPLLSSNIEPDLPQHAATPDVAKADRPPTRKAAIGSSEASRRMLQD